MPTFDFVNVVRKIVSTAVSAVASPVSAVLASSALIASLVDDVIKFFNDDFSLPHFTLPSLNFNAVNYDLLNLFLYAVDFDTAKGFINSVLQFIQGFLNFGVRFFVSLLAVFVAVGAYRVVRSNLKDYMG